MAKKSSVEKNKRRIRVSKGMSEKRAQLKAKIYDKNLSLAERFALVTKLASLPRDSSKTRVRNRCALTGRPRGYYGKFKLSRNSLRELSGHTVIPGLIKASW